MFRFKEFFAAILQWPLSEIERERSCHAQVPDDRFAAFLQVIIAMETAPC